MIKTDQLTQDSGTLLELTKKVYRRISILFVVFVLILLISCSKEKLDGEISTLAVGEWVWFRSERMEHSGGIVVGYHNPETENVTVTLKILSKGKLIVEKNGDCLRRHRVLDVDEYGSIDDGLIGLALELSKKNGYDEVGFSLRLNGEVDTLSNIESKGFFGLDVLPDNYTYEHIFVKK